MKLITLFLSILLLFSCSDNENEALIRNSIETETQLQQMNVILYENGNRYASSIKEEYHTTPKNEESAAKCSKLFSIMGQINEIDSLTLRMIFYFDVLKSRLIQKDNGNRSLNLNHSIIPNNFDLSLLLSPLDTDISADIFINSDGNSPKSSGIELINLLKSYRKDLVTIVGSVENKKIVVMDINDYENEDHLKEKVISHVSSKVPNPIDDQEAITEIYIKLTLPNYFFRGKTKIPWILETFQHSNLIGAITQLTILQNKILESRSLALAHISSKISDCGYGFNKIIPFSQGPSIIHEGESAEITVGIAAFDSYNQPEITLLSSDGEVLKSENGTGKVRVKPNKGLQKITGTVSIKNKSGIKKTMPWEWDIQVLPKNNHK